MVLDQYLDVVKPDIVVLQCSSNDFINNHYELGLRSARNSNGMRRPYLSADGRMEYRLPMRFPAIREFINENSRFLYFVMNRIDRLAVIRHDPVENSIKEQRKSYPFFREAVEITGRLVRMIRARVPPEVPILSFCVDAPDPYYDEFKRISRENGIIFVDGVPQAVREAEQRGVVVRIADGEHWNETGHKIAAEILKKHLEGR